MLASKPADYCMVTVEFSGQGKDARDFWGKYDYLKRKLILPEIWVYKSHSLNTILR